MWEWYVYILFSFTKVFFSVYFWVMLHEPYLTLTSIPDGNSGECFKRDWYLLCLPAQKWCLHKGEIFFFFWLLFCSLSRIFFLAINTILLMQCNFGHCQTAFHPSCARSTGFYMNVKSTGGNFQHKAYCEKHSLEQRAKVCLFVCIEDVLFFKWWLILFFYIRAKN